LISAHFAHFQKFLYLNEAAQIKIKMDFEFEMVKIVSPPMGYIGVAVDRSGSMWSMVSEVRSGLNMFVKEQCAIGNAHLHIAQFDTVVETVYDGPLINAPNFDCGYFVPRGMTALHDAMDHLIQNAQVFEETHEETGSTKPIIVVFTDGQENSSRCKATHLQQSIAAKRDKGWKFIFMGAQDVFQSGSEMGLRTSECTAYAPTCEGQYTALRSASAEITRTRTQI